MKHLLLLSLLPLLSLPACGREKPDSSDTSDTSETDVDTDTDTDTDADADTDTDADADVEPVPWPFDARVSINDVTDTTITGGKANQHSGVAVAASDLDGDGLDELAITGLASDADNKGRVYIVDGPLTATLALEPDATYKIIGSSKNDYTGFSLAGNGDVDGDGFEDLAIGTPFVDKTVGGEGAMYLYAGPITDDLSVTATMSTFYGTSGTAADGTTVYPNGAGSSLVMGDVNGDEHADVVIGATGLSGTATDGPEHTSLLYVLEGPVNGAVTGKDADIQLSKPTGLDAVVAGAVATVDLDADGYDDIVMGWPSSPDTGAVYIWQSPFSNWIDLAAADAVLTGDAALDCVGSTLSNAGDTNNDGYDDLLVGATSVGDCSDVGLKTAAAWLALGPVTGGALSAATGTVFQLQTAGTTGSSTVAGGGNIDGDDYSDILVGISEDATGGAQTGSVYVFQGPVTTGALSLDVATTQIQGAARTEKLSGAYAWTDTGTNYESNPTILGNADANGDGYSDLLLGAFNYGQDYANEGAAYLVLGGGK